MEKTASYGEHHPRATATDDDVALAIALVEQHGLSSRVVAEKFDVSSSAVRRWVARSRRARR